MPAFKKAYKKLHTNEKIKVNDAIRAIIQNPTIGQEKKEICQAFLFINLKFIPTKFC